MGHQIELMLVRSLHYLRREFTFDALELATFISESSHPKFFHEFIKLDLHFQLIDGSACPQHLKI